MSVRYQLVMRTGPNPGATYSLDAAQSTIGRDASNTISINDAEISRHHARMTAQGGKIVLEDTGSTNGTAVNGTRISGPHVLKPGEMIAFGEDIVFMFEVISFDPDATVVSSSQPAAAPRQQPVAPPPAPPQAYAGQVPAGPAPVMSPPASSVAGKRTALPATIGIGVLLFLCSCGGFFWWVDASSRWCTFFPFISGC
ncbi:MAG: FHA domain-containing protein [Anaerolineae bacterium]|jgi:pSer/pThr/pTyr-binding forkhead associated (FHA) protein|nr:FHA domain-containing protein [Anaerolineae bacterium]MBT7071778.1 FHA domain-containing protein [Anaerolineae bacterium]MBT7600381.1 FHA domain-containing protein [Anaerolineae bacterium]MBT7991103.1 FHA domain-containing protein [Anaerolineae bacterium]